MTTLTQYEKETLVTIIDRYKQRVKDDTTLSVNKQIDLENELYELEDILPKI